MINDIDYCDCEKIENVTTEFNDFGHEWDVCMKCGKPIEDSYKPNSEFLEY